MANEVQTLVDRIVASSGDTTTSDALARYNTAHQIMVARTRCFRKTIAVGNTVAGQAFYPLDVVELYALTLDGVPYGKARRPDVYGYSSGSLVWAGPAGGGLIIADADAAGGRGVSLIPTPTTGGQAISAFAAVPAPVQDGTATPIPDIDFWDDLVDYALAIGRERDDERQDAGAGFRQRFDGRCEELRRRVNRRFRGSGAAQIRVQGLNV